MIISEGQATGKCAIKMGNYTFLKTAKGAQKIFINPLKSELSQTKLSHDAHRSWA